ncbi:hypothetical protein AVEN_270551-1 [Araneus ventricosus]|uniref:Uncharacterized protein n=1 Tax=Araneus ventricosus TaxID=182803 RepID=A0A4Y2B4K2_ARAVE|nr:hypothetical protein AVEN_270551-1 [Araneus ventricosus]
MDRLLFQIQFIGNDLTSELEIGKHKTSQAYEISSARSIEGRPGFASPLQSSRLSLKCLLHLKRSVFFFKTLTSHHTAFSRAHVAPILFGIDVGGLY